MSGPRPLHARSSARDRSLAISLATFVLGGGCASGGGAPPSNESPAPGPTSGAAASSEHGAIRVAFGAASDAITIAEPLLYPETIEVNPLTGRFLVGSVREGAVYEVDQDGAARKLIDDERLISVLGIALDARSQRLLVTSSDLGAGVRHSTRGPKKEAAVGIYDLATGRAIHYVDLTPLLPDGNHLINGIAVDSNGIAYVTDSFSPAIYRIGPDGVASVFLTDPAFDGPGINLNGIVYDLRGFLLVVKKSDGALYRIPVADPQRFERVATSARFEGGDGLLRLDDQNLLLVANKTPAATSNTAFSLQSDDGFRSVDVVDSIPLGDVYPTTATVLGDRVYALSSHLGQWILADAPAREALTREGRRGEIREIGVLVR